MAEKKVEHTQLPWDIHTFTMSALRYRIDPDFRRTPKTNQYCACCQQDIKDAAKALRVTVDWDTWTVTLGGNDLLGPDCAKRCGLAEIGKEK